MEFKTNLKNILLVILATVALSACSTAKKAGTTGDVYTGTDTVEYLAAGVADRVFFATNKTSLTTKSRETLRKQATYLRKNKKLNVTIEGHADERGTREYNLALGERRANAAKDYLMTYGISGKRISVISYGKERPANSDSSSMTSSTTSSVSVTASSTLSSSGVKKLSNIEAVISLSVCKAVGLSVIAIINTPYVFKSILA